MNKISPSRYFKKISDGLSLKSLSLGRKIYYGFLVVLVILAFYFLFSKSETLKESLLTLRSIDPLYIFLALGAQFISYLGSGFIVSSMLKSFSVEMPLYLAVGYEVASESVGVIAGGVVMTAAAMYYLLRSYGVDEAPASIVGWVPDITNLFSHTLLAIVGFSFLFVNGALTESLVVKFLVSLSVLLFTVLGFIWLFRHREVVRSLMYSSLPLVNYFRENSIKKEDTDLFLEEVYKWWYKLSLRDWFSVAFGEFINVVFDVVTLYVLFLSINISAPFGLIVAGYAIPYLSAKIIPGGFGIVEGGMLSIYLLGGVPGAAAAFLVLSFRLFSLWLPLFVGIALTTAFKLKTTS